MSKSTSEYTLAMVMGGGAVYIFSEQLLRMKILNYILDIFVSLNR